MRFHEILTQADRFFLDQPPEICVENTQEEFINTKKKTKEMNNHDSVNIFQNAAKKITENIAKMRSLFHV